MPRAAAIVLAAVLAENLLRPRTCCHRIDCMFFINKQLLAVEFTADTVYHSERNTGILWELLFLF